MRGSSRLKADYDCWNCITRPRNGKLRAWLQTPCNRARLQARSPAVVQQAPADPPQSSQAVVSMGTDEWRSVAMDTMAADLRVHASHHLDHHKGLLWCKRCGCRTSGKKTVKLRGPCSPARGPQLAVDLKRLANRLLPGWLPAWPDDKAAVKVDGPLPHAAA